MAAAFWLCGWLGCAGWRHSREDQRLPWSPVLAVFDTCVNTCLWTYWSNALTAQNGGEPGEAKGSDTAHLGS